MTLLLICILLWSGRPSAYRATNFKIRFRVQFAMQEVRQPLQVATSLLPAQVQIRERILVMHDGCNLQLLCTPSSKEKEILKEKEESTWALMVSRIWQKVLRKLGMEEEERKEEKKTFRRKLPPIVFLHGSYHSSWCWRDVFLPLFSQLGYECYAPSFRGTGPSGMSSTNKDGKTVQIEEHVSDLEEVLDFVVAQGSADAVKPVLVAHSFAGLVAMKLLEETRARDKCSGVCFLCSVPPSGNGPMTLRFLKTRLLDSLKIVYGFVFKAVTFDVSVARELFFDDSFSDETILQYTKYFKADSKVVIDLPRLAKQLPSDTSADAEGRARWLTQSPQQRFLVLGAERDFIVDCQGVDETARFVGLSQGETLPGVYHDAMLGEKALVTAKRLELFLTQNFKE